MNIERKSSTEGRSRKLTIPPGKEPRIVEMTLVEGPVPQVPSAEKVVSSKVPSAEKVVSSKVPSAEKVVSSKVPSVEKVVIEEPRTVTQVKKVTTEKETRKQRAGSIGISLGLVVTGLLAADLAVYLLTRNDDSSNAANAQTAVQVQVDNLKTNFNGLATTVAQNNSVSRATDEAVWAAITKIMEPTKTVTQIPTPTPAETSTQISVEAIKYSTFANVGEVVQVRGGNPDNWVPKVEIRDGIDVSGKADPTDIRYAHTISGTTDQVTLIKNEWMYRGSMTDLNPEYQIPQTVEAIAKQLGGNVKPENIRVIRITHDKTSSSYANWMDLWQVEEGTIVGYELMQNHQTIDGSTSGNGLKPYEFNLPPGAVAEVYDDRQTEEPTDDVAAAIFNPTGESMKLFVSGGTVWPWGDVNSLIIEQSNFDYGASSSAVIDGKVVKLNVASNVLSPQTAHDIANVDPLTGRIVLTGFVNDPGKDPVKDEATH